MSLAAVLARVRRHVVRPPAYARTTVSRTQRYGAQCHHAQCRRRLREWAWERWPHECYMCLSPLTREEATLDHLRPLSRGGRNCIQNVLWACRSCNSWKGRSTLDELWPG